MGGAIGLTGGSIVGFALGLGGPITAVALATGAAYSTTTDGKFGDCMRSCADHGVQACERASELDRRHGLSAKIRSAGVAAWDAAKDASHEVFQPRTSQTLIATE
jgi:hypothetical protein